MKCKATLFAAMLALLVSAKAMPSRRPVKFRPGGDESGAVLPGARSRSPAPRCFNR